MSVCPHCIYEQLDNIEADYERLPNDERKQLGPRLECLKADLRELLDALDRRWKRE
jgi:hypothetical protein